MALDLADRVFAELSVIYGHFWKSQHSTADMWELARRRWAIALSKLKPEEIRAALNACDKTGKPPTIPEFLNMAGIRTESSYACHRFYKPMFHKSENPSPLLHEYMMQQGKK
jgi:hypothetical protein